MEASSIPTLFDLEWGASAGASYIRTIPVASQIGITNGAASFTDGFPPLCFSPVAAGGVPPFGQDFNGALNIITAWLQWMQAGGPIPYNSAFSTAIGGYPNGAIVQSAATPGLFWRSTVDNNTTDPDTGGAGWVSANGGRLINIQRWTTAGTYTYTPTPGANAVIVEAQGGGAGGGSVITGNDGTSIGAPGASGAYGKSRYTSGFSDVTVEVGVGGVPTGIGAAGGPGGASSFGTLLSCPGGLGGTSSAAANIPISGGNGNVVTPTGANIVSGTSNGGGQSLSINGSCAFGGAGGSTPYGGGAPGANVNNNGLAATTPGAGGSGTANYNNGVNATSGGDGAPGYVIVYEFS